MASARPHPRQRVLLTSTPRTRLEHITIAGTTLISIRDVLASPDELAVRLAHGPRSVAAAQPGPGKRKSQTPPRTCRAYQLTQLSTAVVLDASGTEVYRGVDPTPTQIRTALSKAGVE